jgi:hypothetical protein
MHYVILTGQKALIITSQLVIIGCLSAKILSYRVQRKKLWYPNPVPKQNIIL